MKKTMWLMPALVLVSGMAQAALTHTVDFWFSAANDPTGAKITNVAVPKNSTFDVSVWYDTSDAYATSGINLLVGWDNSTTAGPNAHPTNTVGVITGNASPFSSVLTTDGATTWTTGNNQLAGGYKTGIGATRPYGGQLLLYIQTGNGPNPVHQGDAGKIKIADLHLTNTSCDTVHSGSLLLYTLGTASPQGCSFLNGSVAGDANEELLNSSPPPTYFDTVMVTPEPASVLLLVLGGLGLLRRRCH
jgi:hypothetical protein